MVPICKESHCDIVNIEQDRQKIICFPKYMGTRKEENQMFSTYSTK